MVTTSTSARKRKIWGTLHPFFEGGPVVGRKVANATFLEAFLTQDPYAEYHFFVQESPHAAHLAKQLQEKFPAIWNAKRIVFFSQAQLPAALAAREYACFHLSDWLFKFINLQIVRNKYSKVLFPITGPVHTLSYLPHAAGFLGHLWAGASPRDTIIATSDATQKVIANYFDQLRKGYGLHSTKYYPAPTVRRLPLGVNPNIFASPESKESEGQAFRQKLGLKPDQVLFLSFSRVSYFSKMDFLPILDAFRKAQELGLQPGSWHFVLAGRMLKNDNFTDVIKHLAEKFGLAITLVPFPDQPDDEQRRALFAAADVFISPVDNIQETFGLTILEAFSASLPVIASAIDGYKELVEDGQSGFLLPTIGPASSAATNVEAHAVNNDAYHLFLCQQCVVDIAAFAQALYTLGTNASLRKQMAAHGRQNVLNKYTWDSIITSHLELWDELAKLPISAHKEQQIRSAQHPSMPDFMHIFSDYYSYNVDDPALRKRMVQTSAKGKALLAKETPLVVYALLKPKINDELITQLLKAALTPCTLAHITKEFRMSDMVADKDLLVLWALKHDWLEFVPEAE